MNDVQVNVPLERLADQVQLIHAEAAIADGVLTPDQERRFDSLKAAGDRAVHRAGVRICKEIALCQAITREIARLTERRQLFERRIAHRKERLRLHMERLGKQKVEGPLCTVTLRRNAVAVQATASTATGPQRDLFSRPRAPHQPPKRGNHIRVR